MFINLVVERYYERKISYLKNITLQDNDLLKALTYGSQAWLPNDRAMYLPIHKLDRLCVQWVRVVIWSFMYLFLQIKKQSIHSLSYNLRCQTLRCSFVRLQLWSVWVVQWELLLLPSSLHVSSGLRSLPCGEIHPPQFSCHFCLSSSATCGGGVEN